MSHFYGVLQGNRGEATRCGTKSSGIETYTASFAGAIHVRVYFNETDGRDWCVISKTKWHGGGINKVIYRGPVGDEDF
jgi:hypothetical protein